MMRVDLKQLNEERINLDRCYAAIDRQAGLSRRAQALLASAGESGPTMQWFVLRIAPHAEKDVENTLTSVGIETWFPTEKRIRMAPHAKRKVVTEVPACAGYAFVKVENRTATWAGLLSVDGLLAVLGGSCGPVPVSEAMLLKFKKKLEEKSTDQAVVEAAFPVGAAVRIEDGPFAAFNGSVEALLGVDRAVVLVDLFGRFVPVELELAQITKSD